MVKRIIWAGPYRLRDLLDRVPEVDDDGLPRSGPKTPPEGNSAYLVTAHDWLGQPSAASTVLYVGGNTGASKRFRTRIGDLVADACGFFGWWTGHHSGGQALFRWCSEKGVSPLDLHIAWVTNRTCPRCAEVELYNTFGVDALNRKRPSSCQEHH